MNMHTARIPFLAHAAKVTGLLTLCLTTTLSTAKTNVPTDMEVSPLFTAQPFTQKMLRFEEFDLQPLPATGAGQTKLFKPAADCVSTPAASDMEGLLGAPLWPDPTEESNVALPNPWATEISACIGSPITGVIEGRAPGEDFAHQRLDEFPPQIYYQTSTGGARENKGFLDSGQSHGYTLGEFGDAKDNQTGLYNNIYSGALSDGTTNKIPVKFHPLMPVQDLTALWTFGDGTLPPKLLRARYAEPILFRHYNALPIDASANMGFGEHMLTTHEHNGHNPGEADGFAAAYFFPGQFYDYRWPMVLAGHDSINSNATDARAATPCSPGEIMMIADPTSVGKIPVAKLCDPVTLTVNIPGDWHEIMSTHWFHDHLIDRTAQNVYKGSAAMMNYYSGIDRGKEGFRCVHDDPANNTNLCLPSGTALDWGNRDYDVQLLIADKAWDDVGQLAYSPFNTDGFLGDRMTVNWLWDPYLDVRARRYRFRMLNGAVSRFYKIAIVREFDDATTGDMPGPAGSNKSYSRISYHMIANDGNIMEHAVPFPNNQSKDLPIQAIAERYDIVIDFSQFPVGTKLYMINTLEHVDGLGPEGPRPLANILSGFYNPVIDPAKNIWSLDPLVGKFMELRVQAYSGTDLSMNPVDFEVGKKTMIPLVKFTDAQLASAKHRTFEMDKAGGGGGNDDKPWGIRTDNELNVLRADMDRVSAAPEGGQIEIWHILSGGGWAHPVHIHFEEGQILTRYDIGDLGEPVNERLPPLWEMGARKDLYRVSDLGQAAPEDIGLPESSQAVSVAIRFREFMGTYMEHCHNTQHEDTAMLLRWDNDSPNGEALRRIRTPIPTWDGVTYSIPSELVSVKTGDMLAAATSVQPVQLVGDLNGDGAVNIIDFGIFASQFGIQGPWSADLTEDVEVNIIDFSVFAADFGKEAGFPLSSPDPTP